MLLKDFLEQDFDNLYDFMRPLWLETYGDILPVTQIEFLLDKYFSKEGLTHFRSLGYRYRKIADVGVLVTVDKGTEIYLDKLYLLPSARGHGYAKSVFEALKTEGKDITLNVNQANERAVKCYLKSGFVIERKTNIPLGHGMVNCDYEMRLHVKQK